MRTFKQILAVVFLASTLSSSLLLASTVSSSRQPADNNTSVGSVYDISGDSKGMHFKMNVGLPPVCKKASSERMLIKSNNAAAMMLISVSLTARFITVIADYDAGSKTCVVRSVLLQTGSAQI